VTTVCSNKINSLPQVPPPPSSPLHRCLRFHADAPELPRFEEDFTTAPLDPSPGWVDLLPGADSHPFLNLASLAASTLTSTKQPQIRLTKTFSKQLCIRWRLDALAFPWISTWSLFFNHRQRQSTHPSVTRCASSPRLRRSNNNRCFARPSAQL
jgi:hypothetical protein